MADREKLGQIVRKVWLEWASEQPTTKPSWLLRWEELSEAEREVDRRIGETLASIGSTALTRQCDSLTVQLDSCQGALREVIAENTANCDRADKAERNIKDTHRWYGTRWRRLRELFDGTELEVPACAIMANGTASVTERPVAYVFASELEASKKIITELTRDLNVAKSFAKAVESQRNDAWDNLTESRRLLSEEQKKADKAEQDFRHQRAAYQMCSESREEIEATLAEAQEELRRLKELYVSFEEFDAWAEDAKSIDFQINITPTGVELVAKNPWPVKAVITGGLLELKDLQHMQDEPGGIRINAANGWARYKEVVSAKRLFGVSIDFYGFELLESEWEEPK